VSEVLIKALNHILQKLTGLTLGDFTVAHVMKVGEPLDDSHLPHFSKRHMLKVVTHLFIQDHCFQIVLKLQT
jgi:hypothetical protein